MSKNLTNDVVYDKISIINGDIQIDDGITTEEINEIRKNINKIKETLLTNKCSDDFYNKLTEKQILFLLNDGNGEVCDNIIKNAGKNLSDKNINAILHNSMKYDENAKIPLIKYEHNRLSKCQIEDILNSNEKHLIETLITYGGECLSSAQIENILNEKTNTFKDKIIEFNSNLLTGEQIEKILNQNDMRLNDKLLEFGHNRLADKQIGHLLNLNNPYIICTALRCCNDRISDKQINNLLQEDKQVDTILKWCPERLTQEQVNKLANNENFNVRLIISEKFLDILSQENVDNLLNDYHPQIRENILKYKNNFSREEVNVSSLHGFISDRTKTSQEVECVSEDNNEIDER